MFPCGAKKRRARLRSILRPIPLRMPQRIRTRTKICQRPKSQIQRLTARQIGRMSANRVAPRGEKREKKRGKKQEKLAKRLAKPWMKLAIQLEALVARRAMQPATLAVQFAAKHGMRFETLAKVFALRRKSPLKRPVRLTWESGSAAVPVRMGS